MAKDEKKKEEKVEKAPLTPEEEAAKGKKKKLILFGVIGLLVIMGGAAAAFFLLGKGGKPPADDHGSPASAGEQAEGGEEGDPHAKTDKKTEEASHGETKKDDQSTAKKDDHGGAAKKDEKGAATKDDSGATKKDDGHGEKKDEQGAATGKKDEDAPPEYSGDFGLIKEFKPFHLNLGNPLENRYVRVSIGVEYKGGSEQLVELNRREPQLRDAVVSIISRKTREHLLSPDGKDQVRLEIKNKINQHLDKKIENIFITDILIE